MKLSVLYHPESDSARRVIEFAHDFKRQTSNEAELISLETTEGAELARLYGIENYPAVLARRETGELLNSWQGDTLPLINEVAGYVLS